MCTVNVADRTWHARGHVESIYDAVPLSHCGWKLNILRAEAGNGSSDAVFSAADCGFVNTEGVADRQLKSPCGIESQCHEQLIHW